MTGDPSFGSPVLTEREHQVLTGISYGYANTQIALNLFLSEDTVKSHAHRLFRKLGARGRAHAVRIALEAGLLEARVPLTFGPPLEPPSSVVRVQPLLIPESWLVPVGPGDPPHLAACYAAESCWCRNGDPEEVAGQ